MNRIARTVVAAAAAASFSPAFAQSTPIKIGVVTPLTGTYAGIGQQVKWGLDLAARQINASGGVMGRSLELIYEDEEANPAVATQKAEKVFQVDKVDFLTGTVNSGSTLAVGQVAERNQRLIATTVSFSDAITGAKCSPNVFRVNASAGMQSAALAEWVAKEKPKADVFYLGPDYEMGRSTVAAFKSAAEKKGAKSVGEVFAPLDNKDYSPFFGQIRVGAPERASTPRWRATTRCACFSQMAEFGVARNVQLVGASGTVTSQNLAAIGKAADGFVTGVGYSPQIDSAREQEVRRRLRGRQQGRCRTSTAPTATACCSSTRPRSRRPRARRPTRCATAMRGLEWPTPQGVKTMRAGDHQAMQDMYAVRVTDGSSEIVGKVPGEAAIGADACTASESRARPPRGPCRPPVQARGDRDARLAPVRPRAAGDQRPVDRRGRGPDGARPDHHLRPARRHQHGARRVLCASAPTSASPCSRPGCRSGGRSAWCPW